MKPPPTQTHTAHTHKQQLVCVRAEVATRFSLSPPLRKHPGIIGGRNPLAPWPSLRTESPNLTFGDPLPCLKAGGASEQDREFTPQNPKEAGKWCLFRPSSRGDLFEGYCPSLRS
uniref:Uncharacterized protein n=1 Tax=Micrurus paraensis TaxID=1970185 RepID=A0A2D4KZL0_9SAUR